MSKETMIKILLDDFIRESPAPSEAAQAVFLSMLSDLDIAGLELLVTQIKTEALRA